MLNTYIYVHICLFQSQLCESDLVDYIQVQEDASSTPTPQATTTPNANLAPTTVVASTSMSATPTPVVCDKLVKYADKTGIVPNRYVLILKKQTDMNNLITQLKNFMTPGAHSSIEVKEVIPMGNIKMITVETNHAGLEWVSNKWKFYLAKLDFIYTFSFQICQNEHVEKIDHDKDMTVANPVPTTVVSTTISATPTPVVCDKLVKYDDKTGIIPNRYILLLKKDTSQTDMNDLITQLKNLIKPEGQNSIKVNEVVPAEDMKMITVEMNQAGLQWVSCNRTSAQQNVTSTFLTLQICQNEHVEKIDHDKAVMMTPVQPEEPSSNIKPKCNKLRGALPESGVSLCKIYMTKSNNQQDCSQFIERMKAMSEDPDNTIQFTVAGVYHHKQRPMIKAKLNLDAINTVSTS